MVKSSNVFGRVLKQGWDSLKVKKELKNYVEEKKRANNTTPNLLDPRDNEEIIAERLHSKFLDTLEEVFIFKFSTYILLGEEIDIPPASLIQVIEEVGKAYVENGDLRIDAAFYLEYVMLMLSRELYRGLDFDNPELDKIVEKYVLE